MNKEDTKVSYNYTLQVWIVNGLVERCGHTEPGPGRRPWNYLTNGHCCNASRYAGMTEAAAVEFHNAKRVK